MQCDAVLDCLLFFILHPKMLPGSVYVDAGVRWVREVGARLRYFEWPDEVAVREEHLMGLCMVTVRKVWCVVCL